MGVIHPKTLVLAAACVLVLAALAQAKWRRRMVFAQVLDQERRVVDVCPGLTAAVTAQEAFSAIKEKVFGLDKDACLTHIASGEDIDRQGRSTRWWFCFILPQGMASADYELRPAKDWAGGAVVSYELEEHVMPESKPVGLLAEAVKAARVDMRQFMLASWREKLKTQPVLPREFIDSKEAVLLLERQGADFVSGSTGLTLEAEWSADKGAVWAAKDRTRTWLVSMVRRE